MLRFVFHKLISKKWLALCLLIGDILLVAVASSNPLYSDAVLQRALTKTLGTALVQTNAYPAEVTASRNGYHAADGKEKFGELLEDVRHFPETMEIPCKMTVEEHSFYFQKAKLTGIREDLSYRGFAISSLSDFEDHIRLVAGVMPSDVLTDGTFETVISETVQRQKNYLMGDVFEVYDFLQDNGRPYKVKVVGIYTAASDSDLYWNKRASVLNPNMIVSEKLFRSFFEGENEAKFNPFIRLSVYLDYASITPEDVQPILTELQSMSRTMEGNNAGQLIENLSDQLEVFQPKATQFRATLTVLYAPVFALLAAFIFMVSRQLMELEENEIAVIVSRGSRKWQIVMIYFLQAAIMSVFGILIGYPAGYLICNVLGASNAFLELIHRQALPVRFSFGSLGFACAAAAGACAFMTLPVTRYASRSIVQYKVQKQNQNLLPWWQKIFLDVILLGVSLYALYSFTNQKAYLAEQVIRGGALDPLLYFSSSVFIIGAGLLGIRILPYLIRLVNRLGRKIWPPAIYTANLRVIRTRNQQSFIMLFMILTIALGIFNSTSARTINGNAEQRIEYLCGADVVVQEKWEAIEGQEHTYFEPNFKKYGEIPGIESYTKVYRSDNGSISDGPQSMKNVQLMGISTKEFGQTAEFDSSLLPTHWYHYLNAISQDPNGILMSSNFRDVKGYQLGDVVKYYDKDGGMMRGIIYGFVDYWPGFAPKEIFLNDKEEVTETSNYLIVANLSQMQSVIGVQPYEVWMKVTDSTKPVYEFAQENGLQFQLFRDKAAELINMKNEPLYQGTNGVLTANFIVVLVLCMVGFLIYWILSIRSRELQFGIFRAMGMSMREVVDMLVVEQVLISGSSVIIGVVVGAIGTRLYLPLIQIAYSAADQVLPLQLMTYWGDSVRLFGVIAVMIVICMVILAWLISKIRIAQALKLGED